MPLDSIVKMVIVDLSEHLDASLGMPSLTIWWQCQQYIEPRHGTGTSAANLAGIFRGRSQFGPL